jgi:hypothetical protein
MPKLFFNQKCNGESIKDWEGTEFENLEDARNEAVASGRELAADLLLSGKGLASFSIEVADDVGNTIFVVALDEVLQIG